MSKKWNYNIGTKTDDIFEPGAYKIDLEIKKIGSNVTAQQVCEYAKENHDSELHKHFEWDDMIAAEKFRLLQAQNIILLCLKLHDFIKSNKGEK